MISVRKLLSHTTLKEPARTHALALFHRAAQVEKGEAPQEQAEAWAAGLEYLASRVDDPDVTVEPVAAEHDLAPWQVYAVLADLRELTRYRAYVGEWIRSGKELAPAPELPAADDDAEAEPPVWIDPQGVLEEPPDQAVRRKPAATTGQPLELSEGTPAGWRVSHALYPWQEEAAKAWAANGGRGIVQVVTGAGKTLLAVYLLAKLREDLALLGQDLFTVIVVPRIVLVDQWRNTLRRSLDPRSLRIGAYHSGERCFPPSKDVLIITQDSARRLLPEMTFDRPVLLVADECHRLGAPEAARVFDNTYDWRLGLSATPERAGDFGFEEVLEPNLGKIIFRYGYAEAVRDGIISPFVLVRVKVGLTPEERAPFDELSTKITQIGAGLRTDYPELRRAAGKWYFKTMGALAKRHPHDERFAQHMALSVQRREIVHLAAEKLQVVADIARQRQAPRRVLCFHERIEAADQLAGTIGRAGRSVATYHSGLTADQRVSHLEAFRSGSVEWLVACRSLDEGLDVPEVDTVVIVAGSTVSRQIIQRLGRALRKGARKTHAEIIILEVAGIDEGTLDQEDLDDLRSAAQETLPFGKDAFAQWLVSAPPTSDFRVEPIVTPVPQPHASKPSPRPGRLTLTDRFRRWIRPGSSGGSWTGTPGNKSYYDKDQSPD